MGTQQQEQQAPNVDTAIAELVKVLKQLQRNDLVGRATAALMRLRRPSTVVCVVGEFKQGKSSLINALVGRAVCPVDDDLATSAITLVHHAETPVAVVRHRDPGSSPAVTVAIEDLDQWVSESGNPANNKQVERVEIGVPSPLLRDGLMLVDTPGMGGLGAGHAAATLTFLPFADGLIFVSDVSAELSAPEIEFLRRALDLCPTVMFAQTKIDLYHEWERVVELNRGHLSRAGLQLSTVGVSSSLRLEALNRKDRSLNDKSHIPELVRRLSEDVVGPAKSAATQRSANDAMLMSQQLRAALASEREALADPSQLETLIDRMQTAKNRIEFLKGPGAKWIQLLSDRVSDLSASINHEFRSQMRTISRAMDERIEVLTKGDQWDDLGRYLQTVIAEEVSRVFVALEAGRASIRAEVVAMLGEEDFQFGDSTVSAVAPSVTELWRGKDLDTEGLGRKAFQHSMTGLKGAQGGMMMLGSLGRFLPAAGTALLAINPVALGIGAIFGGLGIVEDKKRKVASRRQSARSQVRQFIDDVQFEVGNQISTAVKDMQREMRNEFGERLSELLRTYSETATRAQEDGQKTQAQRERRLADVDATTKTLSTIEAVLAGAMA